MVNDKIGFNDTRVMLIAIPLLSLSIPFIFFSTSITGSPYFQWQGFLIDFVITTSVWLGNRQVMVWARKQYPFFIDVKKRLKVQSFLMIAFTLVASNTICILSGNFSRIALLPSRTSLLIHANIASLFCTVAIGAIYESVYFMDELKKSIEEKAFLQKENLRAQLDALKSQVNPHFLFNNLNTLSSLIPEEPKNAVAFVQQLSKVYRHILEVQDMPAIYLESELDVLNAYAFLLKTRFGDNLQIRVDVPQDKLNKMIVPLSLQILMENAIKHNIVSASKPLNIELFTQDDCIIVKNNLQKKNQVHESTGIGLNNIRNRYKLLGNEAVAITEDENNFTVSIPLIDTQI